MNPPSPPALLDAWERGLRLSVALRPLVLLCAAEPTAFEELARLPVGRRDARLLKLRRAVFGSEVSALADCPRCRERLELSLAVDDLVIADVPEPPAELRVMHNDRTVRFRLPNSRDLDAAERFANPNEARLVILSRCILDEPPSAAELPEGVVQAIAGTMAAADPQAEVLFQLDCPACGNEWSAPFDIASFLWDEVTTWANRTVREVHELATAYGWTEAEILGLSPTRRRQYLELVRQ